VTWSWREVSGSIITADVSHGTPLIAGEASVFEQVNHSNEYHKRYWYTSQLFDPDWAPRDTLEHAPPVETPSEGSQVA